MEVNVHDIVYLESNQVIKSSETIPNWVLNEETANTIAVVRRMKTMNHIVPIGFRGANRSERFAAFTTKDNIRKVITAEEATHGVPPTSHEETIEYLRDLFKDIRWGIGGSIGFTMATGIQACTEYSDVDIILYKERFTALQPLQLLHEKIQMSAHPIDVQVEITNLGACMLNELVTSPTVLLRTSTGVLLMDRDRLVSN
ncbi:malonate decarboxylase holo-ACP synthase [Sporosarcina sp. P2]|uniref:malonate decarboxylase holo-ACP synthase n=1 Tax=Sporosarcina sp. P2 TaxID=2048251 RepID=UPI000C16549B|nr:malonate decarboxylase holo-ACP synthase [Sporosarcina sp. P2]PID04235.1 malonate decarboxylase holo-ACP synthase [Sporosarcina sp. P2]